MASLTNPADRSVLPGNNSLDPAEGISAGLFSDEDIGALGNLLMGRPRPGGPERCYQGKPRRDECSGDAA
jgi:hypothetical protein